MKPLKLFLFSLFSLLICTTFTSQALAGRDSGGIGEERAGFPEEVLEEGGGRHDCYSRERCRVSCNIEHPDDDRAFNACIQRCNRAPCVD